MCNICNICNISLFALDLQGGPRETCRSTCSTGTAARRATYRRQRAAIRIQASTRGLHGQRQLRRSRGAAIRIEATARALLARLLCPYTQPKGAALDRHLLRLGLAALCALVSLRRSEGGTGSPLQPCEYCKIRRLRYFAMLSAPAS